LILSWFAEQAKFNKQEEEKVKEKDVKGREEMREEKGERG